MKKFRLSALALSVLLCGSVFAACGGGDDDKPEVADSSVKTEVFDNVGDSFNNIISGTEDKTYKVIVDMDFTMSSLNEKTNKFDDASMAIDGELTFKYVAGENGVLNVDAFINGLQSGSQGVIVEDPEMYAAAYIRNDKVVFGSVEGEDLTAADKNGMALYESTMAELMAMIENSMGGVNGKIETVATGEDEMGGMQLPPSVMALLPKVLENVIAGAEATVVKNDGVTTLTYDIKAEMNSIYNTAKTLADSIKDTTTIGDLLKNEAFKAFFNKYLGTITAAEIKTAVEGMVAAEAASALPEVGTKSGYDYAIEVAELMFADYLEETIGSAEMKTEINNVLTQVKASLDMFKELNVGVSVKNDAFYGVSFKVNMENPSAKLNAAFSMTMEETTYTFVDLTGKNITPFPSQAA